MEQRAVIRFFTLKGLKAKEIRAEPESVYGTEALTLSTLKKWGKRFHKGRTDLIDDRRPESRSHTILLRQFSQRLQNDHFCRVRFSVGTSALERQDACESFTMI
jgi:hypothetical protein